MLLLVSMQAWVSAKGSASLEGSLRHGLHAFRSPRCHLGDQIASMQAYSLETCVCLPCCDVVQSRHWLQAKSNPSATK